MIRRRHQPAKRRHYALLANRKAGAYNRRLVEKFVGVCHRQGASYTVYEPDSAVNLLRQAEVAVGLRPANSNFPPPYERGGPVTALVACGGDGTFNLVARAALKAGLPVGMIPMGRINNLALSLFGSAGSEHAIRRILAGGIRKIDCATAANLVFFGSLGLGFVPKLLEELQGRSVPSLGLGWSQLASKAAASVTPEAIILKVDAFRFDCRPVILNVNLLPYTAGLPLSPASVPDDGRAEVIFDQESNLGNISAFTRLIFKRKYLYGDAVRLYRGQSITVQPVKGRRLYFDGELIDMPADTLEVKVGPEKLQVLC